MREPDLKTDAKNSLILVGSVLLLAGLFSVSAWTEFRFPWGDTDWWSDLALSALAVNFLAALEQHPSLKEGRLGRLRLSEFLFFALFLAFCLTASGALSDLLRSVAVTATVAASIVALRTGLAFVSPQDLSRADSARNELKRSALVALVGSPLGYGAALLFGR